MICTTLEKCVKVCTHQTIKAGHMQTALYLYRMNSTFFMEVVPDEVEHVLTLSPTLVYVTEQSEHMQASRSR